MSREKFHVQACCLPGVIAIDACSSRSFARHTHDEFGVGLLTEGAQRSASGRGQVESVRGNLITVNPAELHDGVPVGEARSWSMLYLTRDIIGGLVADIEEGRRSSRELHAPVIDDVRLARLFIAARQAALHPHGGPAFQERLLVLFGHLFGDASPERAMCGRLSEARQRIDDAPAHSHPLTELASLAGLNKFQTVRTFARLTGLTPHAYVIQRRLEMARRLIRDGCALVDAALEAGFSDQSHLHRTFVARYGFTPGAFAAAVHPRRAISSKSNEHRVAKPIRTASR